VSIRVVCEQCGRGYFAPPTFAGKRVRCRACGCTFTIATPTPTLARTPALSRQLAVPIAEEQSFAPVALTERAPLGPRILQAVSNTLSRIQVNHWIVLGCLLVATGVGFFGGRLLWLWCGAVIGFPVLGLLFIIVAIIHDAAKGLQRPGNWKYTLKEVAIFLIGGVLLYWLIGLAVHRYRVRSGGSAVFTDFSKRVVWSFAIMAMSIVTFGVSEWSHSLPWTEPPRTMSDPDPIRVLHKNAPQFGVTLPMPMFPPLNSSLPLPQSAGSKSSPMIASSERNLRRLAAVAKTYLLNAHRPPAELPALFRAYPQYLISPFDRNEPIGYVYIPENLHVENDDSIIIYDSSELDATGSTQAITNGFHILKLSRDELRTRTVNRER